MWTFIKRFLVCCVLAFLIVAITGQYFHVSWDFMFDGIVHAVPFLSEDYIGFAVVLSVMSLILVLIYSIVCSINKRFNGKILVRIILLLASSVFLIEWVTGGCFGISDFLGPRDFGDLGLVWVVAFIVCLSMLVAAIRDNKRGGGGDGTIIKHVKYEGEGVWRDEYGSRIDGPWDSDSIGRTTTIFYKGSGQYADEHDRSFKD